MENRHHAPRKVLADTREHWPIMSVYERFEQVVAIVLSLVVAVVIALALVQLVNRIVLLLLSGAIDPLEHNVFQALFGMMVALESRMTNLRLSAMRAMSTTVLTWMMLERRNATRTIECLNSMAMSSVIREHHCGTGWSNPCARRGLLAAARA